MTGNEGREMELEPRTYGFMAGSLTTTPQLLSSMCTVTMVTHVLIYGEVSRKGSVSTRM